MQAVIIFVIAGLIGGAAIGVQAPLTNMIGQRLGSLESVFIVHLVGAIGAGVPLLMMRGGALGEWRALPWYVFLAGLFGVVIVSVINFTIPRLGATATTVLLVAGQLLLGVVIDHFGLLAITPRPVDLTRLVGIIVMFAGVYLIIR